MNTNSNISIFKSDNFGELRVITRDGEPWFMAKEIATQLEYRDTHDATKYLDDDEVGTCPDNSSGQVRHITIVSESGLYSIILRSRKPEARAFKRWVTREVLPCIRKHGAYIPVKEGDTPDVIMARGLMAADSIVKELRAKLAETAPRAEKYDTYLDVGRNESVGTFAKTAQDAGINVGVEELFRVFRFKRVLCSGKGVNWNQPYANFVKAGFMTTKPIPPQKREEWRCTPLVTPKGKDYFLPRLPAWIEEYREFQGLGEGVQNFLEN